MKLNGDLLKSDKWRKSFIDLIEFSGRESLMEAQKSKHLIELSSLFLHSRCNSTLFMYFVF